MLETFHFISCDRNVTLIRQKTIESELSIKGMCIKTYRYKHIV